MGLKGHSLPTDWKKESLPKKNWKHFCQNLFEGSIAKTLWREIYAKQIPAETSTKEVLEETFLPQTPWREISTKQFSKEPPTTKYLRDKSTPPKKKLYQKRFEDKIRPKYVWRKNLYQAICEWQLSTKQTLNRNIFQTNSKGNLPKSIWKSMPTKRNLKRNLYGKKIWRENSPPKKFSNNYSNQKFSRRILPRKLWRDIPCKINIWRTISTKK